MKKMIAYCGLDCEKCDAYIATINDDQTLREGCRADGVKTVFCDSLCEIRRCALKKNVTTCGDCTLLGSCGTVGKIHANDPQALANLKEI